MKVKLTWSTSTSPVDQAPTFFRIFYWVKGTTPPTSPNQTVSATSVCTGTSCTYSIDGLSDNVAYDFRIDTTCINGDPAPSPVITLFTVVCPTVTLTATNKSVSYSFAGDVGANSIVTGYQVQLYEVGPAPGNALTLVEDEGILSPAATVSGTFGSVLNAETLYRVRVIVKNSVGGVPQADKVCESDITTTDTPSCNAVTNLVGCICGVDCAQACS